MSENEIQQFVEPLSSGDNPQITQEELDKLQEQSDKLNNDIIKVQNQITLKREIIQSQLEKMETDKQTIRKQIATLNEFNNKYLHCGITMDKSLKDIKVIVQNGTKKNNELLALKRKYEEIKGIITIQEARQNELLKKLLKVKDEKVAADAKYESLLANNNSGQVDQVEVYDADLQEIAKLKSSRKRLGIRISSLEVALKQNTENCVALNELLDAEHVSK